MAGQHVLGHLDGVFLDHARACSAAAIAWIIARVMSRIAQHLFARESRAGAFEIGLAGAGASCRRDREDRRRCHDIVHCCLRENLIAGNGFRVRHARPRAMIRQARRSLSSPSPMAPSRLRSTRLCGGSRGGQSGATRPRQVPQAARAAAHRQEAACRLASMPPSGVSPMLASTCWSVRAIHAERDAPWSSQPWPALAG